jgi:hypothetical protein
MASMPTAPTGEEMFAAAIASTLRVPPPERAPLFERLTAEIAAVTTAPDSGLRPWTCTVHTGTDGSRIFRGGEGSSLVIDPTGRLWRARSHEDFDTTYTLTPTTCEIATLTPHYEQMTEYERKEDLERNDPEAGAPQGDRRSPLHPPP